MCDSKTLFTPHSYRRSMAFKSVKPHHAFRIGNCAWGLQFHPEFDEDIMRAYLIVSALKLSNSQKTAAQLLKEIRDSGPVKQLISHFIENS